MEEKALSLGKFKAIATRDQRGLTLHLDLLKYDFSEHHVRSAKPTMMQKVIITLNPTNLIKVTYISSILKFLKIESLVVQVSNNKFNIQSLHFWT